MYHFDENLPTYLRFSQPRPVSSRSTNTSIPNVQCVLKEIQVTPF